MREPCFDNFGGPAAWDAYCADIDAGVQAVRSEDPGCGTCTNYMASDYSDEHGKCIAHGELVEAHGYVWCEYESYSEG